MNFHNKNNFQQYIYIGLLVFITNIAFSQTVNEYPFEQLTKKNGLPSSMVYQVTKDHNGFIWIATNDGLVRFDGVNERIYQHNPLHKNSISNNRIRSLLYDNNNQLWVGTIGNGLNLYNQEADNFTTFLHDKNDSTTLNNNDILSIFQDSKSRIWVGTEGGLHLFNQKDKNFRRFTHKKNDPKSIGADPVLKIFEDSKGHIWVGNWDGGLNLLIPEGDDNFSFLPLQKDPNNPTAISSNHIWDLVEDDNNRIWLATFEGDLVSFDMPEGEPSTLTAKDFKFVAYQGFGSLTNNQLFSIGKDKKGDIWVGTSLGLGIFNPNDLTTVNTKSSNIFYTILFSERESKTLPHNEIRHFFFDKEKEIMWVSTFGGIGYHFMSKKKFQIYQSPIKQAVSTMIQSTNNIQYLGLLNAGLIELNTENNNYKHFRHDSKNLSYDRIISMEEFGNNVWLGSQTGLSIFNKQTKELKIVKDFVDTQISNFSIIKIFEDSKNRIWLASGIGLIQTDLSFSKVILYTPDDTNPNAISDEVVTDIEEDKDGNLWVVTCGGGLNKLTFDTNDKAIFKRYNINSRTDNIPITNLLVFAEIEDETNTIWIGSEVGMMKYLIDEDKFINDLPFIRSRSFGLKLIGDNLWISDAEGITKYNTKSNRVSQYSIADGLQSGGFLYYSYHFDEQNELLFFGGVEGYQLFNPTEIIQDNNLSPLLITDLKIFNNSVSVNEIDELSEKVILTKNITGTEKINLSYLHTSITLSVTTLDFESASRYEFAYKLDGLEDDWKYTKNPAINYSRLPNGKYTFIIKAKNSDGFWSPETRLEIKIHPPFWKRLDFIFLIGVFLLLTIIWFVYSKIKQINLAKENLETLVLKTSTTLPSTIQKSLSAEDILKENKLFFEKLYLESPLGITFADGDFNMIKFNNKFKTIFNQTTINKKLFFDFIAVKQRTKYILLIQNLIQKQKKTFRQDIPFEINEELVWLNTAFSFLYNEDKELRYVIIKVSDVTARKTQEKIIRSLVKEVQSKNEELEEKVSLRTQDLENTNKELTIKNEELARFAYIASHDLKEPLRNISSFIGLINRKAKKEILSAEILEYLNFVKVNAHQMHTIVNDVLEYSKFDEHEFIFETVNLNEIFREIELIISNYLIENNAQIIVSQLPTIESNRGFLFLLIKNLIENGIKYNQSKMPIIEVSCMETSKEFILEIKDNGIGIEPQYHEQIFKMFKRLHNQEKYKGSGLGLAVCKKIIEKMGGTLTIESELGQGSTFIIAHPKYSDSYIGD
jgi:PAS domain S-box-containing protein